MYGKQVSLLLKNEGDGCWAVMLHHEGGELLEKLPVATPAEDLIAAAEIDYRDYRRAIQHLRDEHPLFEESIDISEEDFEDFVAEALLLPSMLLEADPVSFFVVGHLLHMSLQQKDDGSASFLLSAAGDLLRILEEPLITQVRLRNILEMAFDGMERATQQEQYEKLKQVYPEIAKYCDPALVADKIDTNTVCSTYSILGLRTMELALYFRQDKQRIARCEYCWCYFIPKTRKETHYCDRVTDGYPCKERGSRFKRNRDAEQDPALLVCKQLRDRMYARLDRYQASAASERTKLIPMDYEQYDEWSENARLARMEYLDGNLSGEDFLRKIDTTHELDSYAVDKLKLVDEVTVWQNLVVGNIDFDSEMHYPSEFMFLDLGVEKPEWETFSADDLRRRDQEGHQSLRDEFMKK